MKRWSEQEIKYLRDNVKICTVKELATYLSRQPHTVRMKIYNLRLLEVNPRKTIEPGDRFGRLIALERLPLQHGKIYWLCRCDCGNPAKIRSGKLLNKRTSSCGCYRREFKLKEKGNISLRRLYGANKAGANTREYEFALTFEQFVKIVEGNCVYCGTEPRDYNAYLSKDKKFRQSQRTVLPQTVERAWIKANTVDRQNNKIGYIYSNCVPACIFCNNMKGTKTKEEFMEHVKKIFNFKGPENES